MMIGTLAIAGIVPLSGFFSKDEILFRTFLTNKAIWMFAVVTALMTAFYMFRLMSMTFFGAYRGPAWEHGQVRWVRRVRQVRQPPCIPRQSMALLIPPIRTRTAKRTRRSTTCRMVRPTIMRRTTIMPRTGMVTARGTGRTNHPRP